MNKLLSRLITATVVMVMFIPLNLQAQDTLLVPHTVAGSPVGALNATIVGDTTSTGAQAHSVYQLENDKIYLMNAILITDYDLNLVGEAPDPSDAASKPPVIQAAVLEDNSRQGSFIHANSGNVTLRGVMFNGNTPDGLQRVNHVVKLLTDGQRLTVDGCHIEGMRSHSFYPGGTLMKVYMTNSVIRGVNSSDIFSGCFFRGGGQYDTLVVKNTTYINSSSYAWVNAKPSNYALWDHNTFANIMGDFFFAPGMANTTITNNIFYNIQIMGQTSKEQAGGWFPFRDQPHSVIDLDTLKSADWPDYIGANRNIHVNNNVYFNDSVVEAWWDEVITVTVPDVSSNDSTYLDTLMGGPWMNDRTVALFASNSSMSESNNQSLDPMFTSLPVAYRDSIIAHCLDYRVDRSTSSDVFWQYEADANWSVVQYPMDEDMSYTNAAAMTASTNGGPVGDLRWMDGTLSSKEDNKVLPKDFTLHQNYPNPFNPTTDISFTLNKESEVTLTIFNMLGQQVKELTSGLKPAGNYTLQWNGSDNMGARVSSGIYLYTLNDGSRSHTKKMVLMK